MPRKTAKQKQAGTSEAIIQSADRIFCLRGYRAATLSEISEAAGFSTGAIYSNFSGKEDLFRECMEKRSGKQRELWAKFISQAQTITICDQDLADMVASITPEAGWRRALHEFLVSPLSDDAREAVRDGQQRWRDTIARTLRAVAQGNALTPALPFEDAAVIVAAMMDGLFKWALVAGDQDIGRMFATSVRLVLSGGSNEVTE
ncbi:MAG TPA: TetR/AcrR family transcriptional regulator [Trebonia sp.]|jgi:AcrR family transcriptional regulator|nr:TetR/AcrR family transcriptional regulator [Trebonia sp.]